MDFFTLKTIIEKDALSKEKINQLGYVLKKEEMDDLFEFIKLLNEEGEMTTYDLLVYTKDFHFGYIVPHLGKEFDLLRLGENFNISIEIKNNSTIEKQKKQILSNHHYLNFLDQPTIYYSFDVGKKKLIRYISEEIDYNFEDTDFVTLKKDIISQNIHLLNSDLNSFFDPSKYLISPFNETNEFLKRMYLLTPQQENITNEIIRDIDNSLYKSYAIEGNAGTGKSLLLYHLALHLKESKLDSKVLVIHSGTKNEGHLEIQIQSKLEIIETIEISYKQNWSDYKWIFVDEAQRIYRSQLQRLMELAKSGDISLIFFFDERQTFEIQNNGERNKRDIIEFVKENGKNFSLTKTIRSNKYVASFIEQLFTFNKNHVEIVYNNPKIIDLIYVETLDDLKGIRNQLESQGFILLGYTPSKYNPDKYDNYGKLPKPHDVIGQEFDKVAVIIDNSFEYKTNKNKKIYYLSFDKSGAYYSGTKMLYQNITRARKYLTIIIINNPQVLEIASSLLSHI